MNESNPTKADRELEILPFGSTEKFRLSITIVRNLIAVPTKSGKSCSERDALKFMMMCRARRLNPFEGDAFLIGYDTKDGPQFSLITAHQAFLKRAELHPEYDGMESGIIIQDGEGRKIIEQQGDFYLPQQTVLGGWAKVFFKNRQHPTYRRLRLERFQKPFGIWQEDPAGMICKCAEADALRSSFPTLLGGLCLREEVEAGVATPQFNDGVVEQAQIGDSSGDSKAPQPAQQAVKPAKSPQQQLADSLLAARISFDDFKRWAAASGNNEAEDFGSFDELPTPFAKRMLNARAAIIEIANETRCANETR